MDNVCLFDLILYVPSTIFQLNRDGSSLVEPVLSYDKWVLLKDYNAATLVRLEPAAPRSRVKHSTTEPLRSLVCIKLGYYSFQIASNKRADQTARIRRLVCDIVVRMQQNQVFSRPVPGIRV